MENLDKIKTRIAKLLAMAADTSTPHESAIAASRARKLLDKYQLEKSDITIASDIVTEVAFTCQRKPTWLVHLLSTVGKFNDCLTFCTSYRDGRQDVKVRGYVDDVQLALQMFVYLKAQGLQQAKLAESVHFFKLGFADGVNAQLQKDEKCESGQALAVVKLANVKAQTQTMPYMHQPKIKDPTRGEVKAYRDGNISGKAASKYPEI